jgi:hypothetical protein
MIIAGVAITARAAPGASRRNGTSALAVDMWIR